MNDAVPTAPVSDGAITELSSSSTDDTAWPLRFPESPKSHSFTSTGLSPSSLSTTFLLLMSPWMTSRQWRNESPVAT